MKNGLVGFALGMAVVLMTPKVMAMPLSFTHHGVMRLDGELVNGSKMITAVLYDDESNEVIGRATKTVLVEDGYYSFTVDNLDDNILRQANKIVLGIKVGDEEELTPRLGVDPVPYAVLAKYSEQANSLECVGCIGREHLDFRPSEVVETLNYAKSDEVGGVALEAKKLICTNCISSAQAAFNYAGSASKGGPAQAVADGSILTSSIVNGAIINSKLSDGAVNTSKVTDKAITTGKLADNSVTTIKIGNLQVTEAKLANSSVGKEKIKDEAVTSGKLAPGAAIINLNAAGYYAPVAWASYQKLSTSAASAYNNVTDYYRGYGAKLSVGSSKDRVSFTFDTARSNVLYAIDVTFLPNYAVAQSEYNRSYVTKIINKTKGGFTLEVYRCVSEVDGISESYCKLDANWITEGTHLLVKIFD